MPSIFDLLPASLWPIQPFIPPVDPGQSSGWLPSPAAPWESAMSTPDDLAPDVAPSGPWDDDRYREMLADAKRASDFVNWIFGPPSGAPRTLTEGTARAARTSKDFSTTPVAEDSFNDRRPGPFAFGATAAPPLIRNPFFPAPQDDPQSPFRNPPVSRSRPYHGPQTAQPETTGQAVAAEPFGGGYAPSVGEFLASRVSARDLRKRGGAPYDLDNYQIVADGAAADHRDADGNVDGFTFTGPAYIFDPVNGAFANVSGTPDRPTSATLDLKTGALRIRR